MKIYNFLFDPDLNNLRLNMDASLVDPLEKGKNIELFDRDIILDLGKPIISAPIKKNINPKVATPKVLTPKKIPPDYSRDVEAPKILHPMEKYTPEEFLKSHKLSKAKLNENLEKRNLVQKSKGDNTDYRKREIKEIRTDQKFVSKNQAIIDKLKNS